MYTSQSCVVGALAVGSMVKTSFQLSRVNSCWIWSAIFAEAAFTGAEGAAGTADEMAAVAWLKKPLILSRRGTWSCATVDAANAMKTADYGRIFAMCEGI